MAVAVDAAAAGPAAEQAPGHMLQGLRLQPGTPSTASRESACRSTPVEGVPLDAEPVAEWF